jgi:hypothetical protein
MNWTYNITIKKYFTTKSDKNIISDLSQRLIDQITLIQNKLYLLRDDDKDYMYFELMEIIEKFESVRDLCNGTIPEMKFDSFGYNENYEQLFNEYLTELYDLADNIVHNKNNVPNKFIWIN